MPEGVVCRQAPAPAGPGQRPPAEVRGGDSVAAPMSPNSRDAARAETRTTQPASNDEEQGKTGGERPARVPTWPEITDPLEQQVLGRLREHFQAGLDLDLDGTSATRGLIAPGS